MNKAELEERTKRFALRVILFVAALPENKVNNVSVTSCSNQARLSVPTTARPIGLSLARTLFTKLE